MPAIRGVSVTKRVPACVAERTSPGTPVQKGASIWLQIDAMADGSASTACIADVVRRRLAAVGNPEAESVAPQAASGAPPLAALARSPDAGESR